MKDRVLELNASDERGIDTVRNRIKNFASLSVATDAEASASHPCPPFKIIILDEADNITGPAQTALRRTIEQYTRVTRFCILCNYVSRIIPPLQSRCARFRFRPLPVTLMETQIISIAAKENITVAPEFCQALIQVAGGDFRQCITRLQASHVRGLLKTEMSESDIELALGTLSLHTVTPLLLAVANSSPNEVRQAVGELLQSGWPATDIVVTIALELASTHPRFPFAEQLTTLKQGKIAVALAQASARLNQGCEEGLCLQDAALQIMQALQQQ